MSVLSQWQHLMGSSSGIYSPLKREICWTKKPVQEAPVKMKNKIYWSKPNANWPKRRLWDNAQSFGDICLMNPTGAWVRDYTWDTGWGVWAGWAHLRKDARLLCPKPWLLWEVPRRSWRPEAKSRRGKAAHCIIECGCCIRWRDFTYLKKKKKPEWRMEILCLIRTTRHIIVALLSFWVISLFFFLHL